MPISHGAPISVGNFDPPRGGYSKDNFVEYFKSEADRNLKESSLILKQLERIPILETSSVPTQEKISRAGALLQAAEIFQNLQIMMEATDL